MSNYADDQVAHKALTEAAEVYNEVLANAKVLGLYVRTEILSDATICPKVWREVT